MDTNIAEAPPVTTGYAVHPADQPIPGLGDFYGAGYVGAILPWFDGNRAIVILADAATGYFDDLAYDTKYRPSPGATSFLDGLANSMSIDDEKHPAAQKCRAYRAGGYEDWHLLAHAPQTAVLANCCPLWTQITTFKEGAPQAFRPRGHWSSTQSQFDPSDAWVQDFGDGDSYY